MIHTPPGSPVPIRHDAALQVPPMAPPQRQAMQNGAPDGLAGGLEPLLRMPEVSRISMRAPPFWKENPALWFVQLESQFITNGITVSDTKYHITVAALETSIIGQVSDVVLNPPAVNKYEVLKQRLQERFTESEERKFKKLLGAMDLGDKLPSHVWREMRELAGNRISDELLKSLWLQRLQPHAQAILSSSDVDMLRLTSMADKIHEVIDSRGIHAVEPQVSSGSANATKASDMDELRQQILALSKQISALSSSHGEEQHRSRSGERSQSRGGRYRRSASRSVSRASGLCWYHSNFGDNAHKCIAPCNFSASKN